MKKLYCVICGKYRKIEKSKISYILEKTFVLFIICSTCRNENKKKYVKKKNQLKILGLIENIQLLSKYEPRI